MGQMGYFNIPEFFIAVERVVDYGARNCALAIAPLNSDRAKLWSVSSEAKQWGVVKGMPVAHAKRLCPELKLLHPNPDLYAKVNRKLVESMSRELPLFENERQGKIYFDYQGMEQLKGSVKDFAWSFKKQLGESFGLPCSIGLASNKLVSKTAAKVFQREGELYQVKDGLEEKFLAPLPAAVIPPVKELQKKREGLSLLSELNLDRVEDFIALEVGQLKLVFNESAGEVYQMVRGLDYRQVVPPENSPSILQEVILDRETNNLSKIKVLLAQLLGKASFELRQAGKWCKSVRLVVRFSDFKLVEKRLSFKHYLQSAHDFEAALFNGLEKMLSRRVSIRYLGLEMLHIGDQEIQLDLFNEQQFLKEDKVLDQIQGRFGQVIGRGGVP